MSEETIPQMRERIDQLTKENKDLAKALPDLQKENRVLKARDIFGEKGFPKTSGELFAAQYPDGEITDDQVTAFVDRYGIGQTDAPDPVDDPPKDEGGSDPDPATGSADLANLSRGGSRAGDGGAGGSDTETLTRAEWQELYARDPAQAKAVARQGRVQITKDNTFSGEKPGPGNPYASE